MDASVCTHSWKDIYEHLCDSRHPLFLNVLDCIAFDTNSQCRPLFWLRTSNDGLVKSRNIRNLTVEDVVQLVLLTSGVMSQKRRVVGGSWEDSKEIVALGMTDVVRVTLNPRALVGLQTLVAQGVDGLVVLKSPGKRFDRRVFIHSIHRQGARYEDSVSVRNLYKPQCEEELKVKIKLASAKVIERVSLVTKQDVREMRLLYRFEVGKREIWLLGMEKCALVKEKYHKKKKNRLESLSVSELMIEERMQNTHLPPVLPKLAARYYRSLQFPPKHPRSPTVKYVWSHSSHHTTTVFDSLLTNKHQHLTKSTNFTPIPSVNSEKNMLKTNETAFFNANFERKWTNLKQISKLNKSFSDFGSVKMLQKPQKSVKMVELGPEVDNLRR